MVLRDILYSGHLTF